MSTFSRLTGHDAKLRDRQVAEQRRFSSLGGSPEQMYDRATIDEGNGQGWQNAFHQTAGAMLTDALPRIRQDLQLTREDGIRRGISTGDLGTSYEGDVLTGWGKNLANAFTGTAMQGYENSRNRYLDLITGGIDRADSRWNAGQNRNAAYVGAGINAVANGAAAYLGKPPGVPR